MNEQQFVTKLLEDKQFLKDACMKVPEDVLREMAEVNKQANEDRKNGAEPADADQMGEMLIKYFMPASQAMGFSFDPATLEKAFDDQLNAKGAFFKLRWVIRFGKDISKAGKPYGIK